MQTRIHLRTLVVSGTLAVDFFHRQGDVRMYLARNRKSPFAISGLLLSLGAVLRCIASRLTYLGGYANLLY